MKTKNLKKLCRKKCFNKYYFHNIETVIQKLLKKLKLKNIG